MPWLWPLVGGAVVIASIASIYWARRRKTASGIDERARRRAAYRVARGKLKDLNLAAPSRDVAVDISLVVRQYLAEVANDPALFETHEEFISRSDALSGLTPSAKAACETLFNQLIALKYAPEDQPLSLQVGAPTLRDGALALVQAVHEEFENA